MTVPSYLSVDELCQKILSANVEQKRFVVGIDGLNGAGKSTLAATMAVQLGAAVYSLDDFLCKNLGSFVSHIDCSSLSGAVSPGDKRITIIEGVCLRAVAERCRIEVQTYVFVRRLRPSGVWTDYVSCCPTDSAKNLRARAMQLRHVARRPDDPGEVSLGLEGDLIDYHCLYRPVERADYFFDVEVQ